MFDLGDELAINRVAVFARRWQVVPRNKTCFAKTNVCGGDAVAGGVVFE